MTISYDRRGRGSPIVLVHGIGSRWQVFEPVLDLLAEQHDVIAVDLPGFGASPMVAGVVPGAQGYAEWLAGWLPTIGVDRPHVVGNSMGGGVALEMAKAGTAARATAFSPIGFWGRSGTLWAQGFVTTIRGLAKVGGAPLDRATEIAPLRSALAGGLYGRPGRLPAEVLRGDLAGVKGATAFAEARASFTGYAFTGPVQAPVTIAWGTRDVLLTHRTQSRRARAALPEANHVDLPGCGHLPFNDDPELCARTVLEA
ncbi:alpha/beta fold hydrolase [Nocardioides montaniterrae]